MNKIDSINLVIFIFLFRVIFILWILFLNLENFLLILNSIGSGKDFVVNMYIIFVLVVEIS